MRNFLIQIKTLHNPDLFFEFDSIEYAEYAFMHLISAIDLQKCASMKLSRLDPATGWYDDIVKSMLLQ